MADTEYKITLRRRLPDGGLEEATYHLERVNSSALGDQEQANLLLDLELQANASNTPSGRPTIRVWVQQDD